ncbi:MAG: COX15/CtaA family protein [Thermoprotei archaeon]
MMIKRLSLIMTLSIYVLMLLGSYTSASGSGLACPDWPLCPIDFTNRFIIIEFIHRMWAIITFTITILTILLIIKNHYIPQKIKKGTIILFIVFIIQIFWGAVAIFQRLNPLIVATHQGLAALIFALAVYVTTLLHANTNQN